ncbi:MAG TPA: excinuclease ABC subunit UvrA, partial [Gammaproteobacteria bacterium]|nr:excinuclease ABC subunit UvrA [Gammaproteobacteria bacterium]
MAQQIQIRGARTHNLKNVDLDLPRDRLIVFTGLSGSGKSSLAFDTLYAEGQRRYVESLSAYARQFLSIMEKPDVDHIEGLSPAISIEQKSTSHNPRSTVGTVTEIYDYLRLLYARAGEPRCPMHGRVLRAQSVSQMVDQVLAMPAGTRVMLLAPVVSARKGEHGEALARLQGQGFVRARIDGQVYELEEAPQLDRKRKHEIEAVVDRLKVRPELEQRLADSFETALALGDGVAQVVDMDDENKAPLVFSNKFACPECGYSIASLEPRLFSFNNPFGACPECDGLGARRFFDPQRIVRHPHLSLAGGAVRGWDRRNPYYFQLIQSLAEHYEFDIEQPFAELPESVRQALLYGSGGERIRFRHVDGRGRENHWTHPFEGIVPNMERRYKETESNAVREELGKYQSVQQCASCLGTRLNTAARNVFLDDRSLPAVSRLGVVEALEFFGGLELEGWRGEIADKIVAEINNRLRFLVDVGLGYLTLDRSADTLSGGEAQRIRLASQIGSGLVGVMYILDEPSIGLHQRDHERLLETLVNLRDLGNTVLMVEHDRESILAADYVVDLGPGAGIHGGQVVAAGTPAEIRANAASLTGQYLSGRRQIPLPSTRREFDPQTVLRVVGARGNNLKGLGVEIPLGLMTCVTGVSGSGKSTLINDTLFRAAVEHVNKTSSDPAPFERIEGLEQIDRVIDISQAPIGRTPRSNPATYTGLFTPMRELFAATQEARSRGYAPGRFSFNVKGGRCEACQGDGLIKVEMHFLPDVYVPCDTCGGQRYNRETLEIRYRGLNVHEVLGMTVEDALRFFHAVPAVASKLQTLADVGLSYLELGQSATTLSGGEAQRVKLSREL